MKNNLLIVFLIAILSVIRMQTISSQNKFSDGQNIRIIATIRSEPLVYTNSQYLRLYGLKVYLPVFPPLSLGDKIVVSGKVIGDKLENVNLIEVSKNKNTVFNFRNIIENVYKKSLPQKEAALVAGMTIGSKSLIDKDYWEILKNSGTAHVVVASGTNVVLITAFAMGILVRAINRRKAVFIVAGTIWFYALLCGFDAPIVRASIMGTVALLAVETGRIYQVGRALVISFLLMLIVNPMWLTDAGFWLSFAASMSLIVFSSKTNQFIKRFKKIRYLPRAIIEGFTTSASAQIGVMPVLLVFFGKISFIAPLVNAIVLWTVVPITAIGALGGILGVMFFPLGKLVLLLAYPLAKYFVLVTTLFS